MGQDKKLLKNAHILYSADTARFEQTVRLLSFLGTPQTKYHRVVSELYAYISIKDAIRDTPGTFGFRFRNEDGSEKFFVMYYKDLEYYFDWLGRASMQEIVSIEIPGLVTKEIEDFFTAGGWKYKDFPVNIA